MSRVVLHVGAPKSGTTFLQRALWARRAELEGDGFHVPGETGRDMFLASIEVREVFEKWGFWRAPGRGCARRRTPSTARR
jgi:hypothetical protein